MTTEEAIVTLRTIYHDIDLGQPDDDLTAISLGIEALIQQRDRQEGQQP